MTRRPQRGRPRVLVVVEASLISRKAARVCLPYIVYTMSKVKDIDVVDVTVIITPTAIVHPILLSTKRNKLNEEFIRDRRLVVRRQRILDKEDTAALQTRSYRLGPPYKLYVSIGPRNLEPLRVPKQQTNSWSG